MTLEICAANLDSAMAAQKAGAHRIELCSALAAGGLTPSPGLLRETLHRVSIPVHVLIRPREGHFVYSEAETDLMCADVAFCKEQGAAGVVVGALLPGGDLDLRALERLKIAAGHLTLTFHRAIDVCPHPLEALEALIAFGFARVLSSGGAPTAWAGRTRLREMVSASRGRIAVMPGGGITPGNIGALALETGATTFHMSAQKRTPLSHPGLPGLPGEYAVSDESTIRQALLALLDHQSRLMA